MQPLLGREASALRVNRMRDQSAGGAKMRRARRLPRASPERGSARIARYDGAATGWVMRCDARAQRLFTLNDPTNEPCPAPRHQTRPCKMSEPNSRSL